LPEKIVALADRKVAVSPNPSPSQEYFPGSSSSISVTPRKTAAIDPISIFCGHLFDNKQVKGNTITDDIDRNIVATEIGKLSALIRKAKLYAPLRIPTSANEIQATLFHVAYFFRFPHNVGIDSGKTINAVKSSQDEEK
jgi:hypothetical protein